MSTSHLNTLEEISSDPRSFGLFAALRVLEQAFPEHPRLGESRKASDDVLRLGQAPHLTFAPSDVAKFEQTERGAKLEQHSFGLFGPNGALPLHLTEHAYTRRHHRDDATFVDFLNVFQHRLVSLFYRAWANSEPAASLDRPDSDRFVTYIGSLAGIGQPGSLERDCVPDYAKLCRAGLFAAQARSADGLEQILLDYFGLPVQIIQFVAGWLEIPSEQLCRLGVSEENATLGAGATLGRASRQCQHKFEIVIGPVTLATFERFLPGRAALRELHALVRQYTNDEWTWQVRLLLRDVEIPGARLSQAGELGWTTWLGKRANTADDVVIQAEAV